MLNALLCIEQSFTTDDIRTTLNQQLIKNRNGGSRGDDLFNDQYVDGDA